MARAFEGAAVAVVGATGVVGSGVVRGYLEAGATVVGLSRSARKLERLSRSLPADDPGSFLPVTCDFDSDESAATSRVAVETALGGRRLDHVVSSVGFVTVGDAATRTSLATLRQAFDAGFFNTFLVARSLLPMIRERHGASYTIVSGGLAHIPPPVAGLWMGTVKNAAVNALTLALAAETAEDAVRVNTLCVHFGVAPAGGSRNQLGMEAERDTLALAPAFLAVARGRQRGQVVCLTSWEDVDRLATA